MECSECGVELSDETGWAMSTTLAAGAPITLFCEDCNPNKGRGYSLSDLERMREESKVQRALREVDLMNMVGPDVYFFIKKREERAQYRQACGKRPTCPCGLKERPGSCGWCEE